jgi:thiol:disulfide interchange protein DsbC
VRHLKLRYGSAGLLAAVLWLAASAVLFADGPLTPDALAAQLPGVEPEDILESPLDGFYQIVVGAEIAYISKDGRHLLQGEVYDLSEGVNLTERTRSQTRMDMLAAVDVDTMIVFGPPDGEVRTSLYVFTDVDCGYCRQFHRDIDKVTALGIEVRYLFYPRGGPNTDSWAKADNVWCAADRHQALTQAKLGVRLPDASCDATPVDDHFSLGIRVGLRGTPAIYTESGDLIGGYLPPSALEEMFAAGDAAR